GGRVTSCGRDGSARRAVSYSPLNSSSAFTRGSGRYRPAKVANRPAESGTVGPGDELGGLADEVIGGLLAFDSRPLSRGYQGREEISDVRTAKPEQLATRRPRKPASGRNWLAATTRGVQWNCMGILRNVRLNHWHFLLALVLLLPGRSVPAWGATIPVPTDLLPRSTYHLVFNSSPVATTGQSSSIAYYNSAVQYAANQAGIGTSVGVTWYAVVSTATIDARVNAVVGANSPVYNMRGSGIERVANGYADFWDGSLAASIAFT